MVASNLGMIDNEIPHLDIRTKRFKTIDLVQLVHNP